MNTNELKPELPTRKSEIWRYQSLRPLKDEVPRRVAAPDSKLESFKVQKDGFLFKDSSVVTFHNGRLSSDYSEALDGITINKIETEVFLKSFQLDSQIPNLKPEKEEIYKKLDNVTQSYASQINPPCYEMIINTPKCKNITILNADSQGSHASRILITVKEGSECSLSFESQDSIPENARLSATELAWNFEDKSKVCINKRSGEKATGDAYSFEAWSMIIGESCDVRVMSIDLGSTVSQWQVNAELPKEHSFISLRGLSKLSEGKNHQNDISIRHRSPRNKSEQLFFSVADQNALGAFHGGIVIDQGSVESDARQTNRNLLLHPSAKLYSRPELWIDCGDVQCSHGSTTGELDSTALFYLKSRGLSHDTAMNMLETAFMNGVFPDEDSHPAPDEGWLASLETKTAEIVH